MGSSLGTAVMLVAIGAGAAVSADRGLWATMTVALLAAAWLVARSVWRGGVRPRTDAPPAGDARDGERLLLRLLLDQAPTPLLAIEPGGVARALNRAARRLFATDDRIVAPPPELLDETAARWQRDGHAWRIDRIVANVPGAPRLVLSLVDVQAEEHAAEARATRELIQVLGHEVMNGLAPIASLAESGLAMIALPTERDALLPGLLETLARRAEALQRFVEGYRALGRVPEPVPEHIHCADLFDELARLFATGGPGGVTLTIDDPGAAMLFADRDQLIQALWALLRNGVEAALAAPEPRTVRLSLEHGSAGPAIVIGDSGAGVPADAVEDIFRLLHTRKPDGSGVGLSLARHIARAHGGDVVLRDGTPTAFALLLPAAQGA